MTAIIQKGWCAVFGYVTVYEKAVSEADFALFKSYYCGLCKAMGRRCSHITRFGLSYDITFLAIVLSSLDAGEAQTENKPCIAHPLKKRESVIGDRAIDYAADMGVLLEYYKLLDDWHDEHSIKALFGLAAFYRGKKKAFSRRRELCTGIKTQLDRLSLLESENCSSIDECADCFAKILEMLFTPEFITDTTQRKALSWLGYNIGRWIYVIDAVNDMKKDHKKGGYNTFNLAFPGGDFDEYEKGIKKDEEFTLTYTLSNAAAAFDLLEIKKNKSLLEGIIYDCLKIRQGQILGTLPKGTDDGSI